MYSIYSSLRRVAVFAAMSCAPRAGVTEAPTPSADPSNQAVMLTEAPGSQSWLVRSADSVLAENPDVLTSNWNYEAGLVLKGLERVAIETNDRKYADYIRHTIDGIIESDGTIRGYRLDEYNIDMINMGKVIFGLLAMAADAQQRQRYTTALQTLRSQMRTHPRTSDGAFWHKKVYPSQMWLDGVYMASPFLAQYAVVFEESALLDDVAQQVLLAEEHMRDRKTGLLYHGWDESREMGWANVTTGTSPSFWARAMGWYAMAVVDVLEHMPNNHPRHAAVVGVLQRLADSIAAYQDGSTGLWWQVLDQAGRAKNYPEASASAMFVYALLKGARHGWLENEEFERVAVRGYRGILDRFVEIDAQGHVTVNHVCRVAGLGGNPYRDGSYEYYTSTEVLPNDPKGVGAFLLASSEFQRLELAQRPQPYP
jgi:unsaturated rhamnogalacturonyl hydrolase